MSTPASPAVTWPEVWRDAVDALRFRPLVCWTLALVAGIAWADWAHPPLLALAGLALVAAGAGLACRAVAAGAARAFMLAFAFLAAGALHTYRTTPRATDITHLAGTTLSRAEATVLRPWGRHGTRPVALVRLSAQGHTGLALLRLPRLPEEEYPRVGERLQLAGVTLQELADARHRPGPFERRALRQGARTRGQAVTILTRERPGGVGGLLRDRAAFFGSRVLETLTRAMPGSHPQVYADLLGSMVYGQQAVPVGKDIEALFVRSGTMHLLVVSGAQVSVLAVGLLLLLRGRRRALPLWALPPVVLSLLAFGLLAGLGVSITRALGMQVLMLVSLAIGRRYDLPTALALVALCLCLSDTSAVFEAGPQLTFMCTLGVSLAAVPAARAPARGRVWTVVRFALLGTAGAWLLSVPILSYHFGQVVLLGTLSNLVALPLSGLILYLGLLAIGLGLVWTPLATPVCLVARYLLDALLVSNRCFAGLPGAALEGVYMAPALIAVWYTAALSLLIGWRLRARRSSPRSVPRPLLVTAAALVALLVIALGGARPGAPGLELHLLDVGAGQCLLIRSPTGAHVMVDAGTEVTASDPARFARREVLPYLALHGVHTIDTLVISHAHADHCNLVPALMAALPVRQLLVGPDADADAAWQDLLRMAQRLGVPVLPAEAGGRLDLGRGAVLDVIGPNGLLRGTTDDANNNNLVLRLTYGQTSVLIPGDLQAEGEWKLLRDLAGRPEMLRSTVLIAGHHGSKYSNTEPFVRAVAPQVVLLSSGRGYQGPRRQGLEVFARQGLEVWQTAEKGNLLLRSDGRRVSVQASP